MHTLRIALCLALLLATQGAAQAGPAPQDPRLIVVISIDQFSAGLFEQYRSGFTGGLKRLATEGVVFPNGYQSHAATETCPGHSTLLTGRHPSGTGIIANGWVDRASGKWLYCVADPAHPVPGRPDQPRGPANLRVTTYGDWLKQQIPGARVFGVSGKDRAAIMMTGQHPDGVFWWDDERGFTTSVPAGTSEPQRLAPVAGFNRDLFARWRRSQPAWTVSNASCRKLTGPHRYAGITREHSLPPPGGSAPGEVFSLEQAPQLAAWFRASPGLDRVTLQLAGELVDRYQLGRGRTPDLLAVSLSATDYIGHRYGNQGPEMCDQLAQLDVMLGQFLAQLAALKLPLIVVLSADHGAVDAAERVAERGMPARRIDASSLVAELNHRIKAQLSLQFEPLSGDAQQLYIAPQVKDPALRGRISDAALQGLRAMPQVSAVFTAEEIAHTLVPPGKPADELTLGERLAESYDAERSADLFVVFAPYATLGVPGSAGDAIAGHGSPWNYDRRVPILFWWPGADGFEQSLPVETVDIAPTLARLSHVATPRLDGRCLDLDIGSLDSCAAPAP
jgi:predicted AlkP superfamily pyrophosphatase or phosphodiesterase